MVESRGAAREPKPLEKNMTKQRRAIGSTKTAVAYFSGTRHSLLHLMLGTEAELTTLSNSEDVHEKRFADRARLALGGGVMWYFTKRPRRQRRCRRIARGGGRAVVAAVAPAASAAARPQAQPPLVTVGHARRDSIYDVVEALGTAQANESVTLTAKVTDTVRRVNFEDGDSSSRAPC